MLAARAYQQQAHSAWFRIDLLLALFDATIKRLEATLAAIQQKDAAATKSHLAKSRLLLAGLVSAVDPGRGEMATRFLSLYGYVNYALDVADEKHIDGALRVLRTLRESLEAIRPQAADLERTGQIPPADAVPTVRLTV